MQNSELNRDRFYPIDLPDVPADAPTFDGTGVPVVYLFTYWDGRFALKSFLLDFPADSEDGRIGGMPVFRGTRVPIKVMLELLKEGENVEEFLSDYTSVDREDALRILEVASELVEVATYENSTHG